MQNGFWLAKAGLLRCWWWWEVRGGERNLCTRNEKIWQKQSWYIFLFYKTCQFVDIVVAKQRLKGVSDDAVTIRLDFSSRVGQKRFQSFLNRSAGFEVSLGNGIFIGSTFFRIFVFSKLEVVVEKNRDEDDRDKLTWGEEEFCNPLTIQSGWSVVMLFCIYALSPRANYEKKMTLQFLFLFDFFIHTDCAHTLSKFNRAATFEHRFQKSWNYIFSKLLLAEGASLIFRFRSSGPWKRRRLGCSSWSPRHRAPCSRSCTRAYHCTGVTSRRDPRIDRWSLKKRKQGLYSTLFLSRNKADLCCLE